MESPLLAGWDNFYVIVGSAAGGLTGITFVVIALARDAGRIRLDGLRAYVSPTMVHFGGVLALAAYVSMPHQHVATLSAGFIGGGIAGLGYGAATFLSFRRSALSGNGYLPVREDWLWNIVLPSIAYAALGLLGILIWRMPEQSLFGVAALSLCLLFIGVRNAWDIAVWMSVRHEGEQSPQAPARADLTAAPLPDQGSPKQGPGGGAP
ncbi:MAG TPA: hypothetical protein VL994_13785 [Steroidobacteraceae bacterium]|nr:hypothetical protein [Steroidobacteraceae bacterium]